ncbi:hypothetical protein B296_00036386 [Ensete ventricosum]|uniref:Uncharacterized protein n=1 Tax=Ensete ventricosum TaxID=4639 RepID=A0A426ZDZ2_ENSVE|nr:hypothetical protein B296_00036386 [Ensete ventricosum]
MGGDPEGMTRYSYTSRCYWGGGNGGGPRRFQVGHKAQEAGAEVGLRHSESIRGSYSMVAYRRGNRRDRSLRTVKTAMSAEQTLPPRVPPGSKTRRRRLPRLMPIPRFLLGPLIWSQRRQT